MNSPMQKQFLTTLLHESLAQEDHAVDQFEGPYYSTSSVSPISTTSPFSLSASGPSSAASSPSLTLTPESPVSSAGKVLLIVPGVGTTAGVNISQPLDFAQVFGKLSSTTPTTTTIINSAIVNDFLQGKATLQSIAEEQVQKQVAEQQQLAFGNNLIKIDPGIHNKSQVDIENELTNDVENFNLAYSLKSNPHSNAIGEIVSSHGSNSTPTPTTSATAFSVVAADYNKLKDILIESSREALELEGSLANRTHKSVSDGENIANVTTTAASKTSQVDPMVILSQAVNLQKVVINFTVKFFMHT